MSGSYPQAQCSRETVDTIQFCIRHSGRKDGLN